MVISIAEITNEHCDSEFSDCINRRSSSHRQVDGSDLDARQWNANMSAEEVRHDSQEAILGVWRNLKKHADFCQNRMPSLEHQGRELHKRGLVVEEIKTTQDSKSLVSGESAELTDQGRGTQLLLSNP